MSASEIVIRSSRQHEDEYLKKWLKEPNVLQWFPMIDDREIDDAIAYWLSFIPIGACLTAEWNGMPCGMANLYIPIYKKISHQCLFSIIVGELYRNKGVGAALIEHLEKLAKEKFQIELLHLEVYNGNPAIHLYQRMGYKEYGKQYRFIREGNVYIDKILMQKRLI
ncbi:MAG: GNAT family N-acetyltransferase [Simkania sp.]|nr:GNAT family N-acetyltransferase [Simkania sp.]